jgi:small-conductance mechanosensitive channel
VAGSADATLISGRSEHGDVPTASTPEFALALQSGGSPDWLDKLFRSLEQSLPELSRVVGAVLAVALGYALSRLFVRLFGRTVARRFERPSITRTVIRGVRVFIVLGGVLTGMYILGFRPGDLLVSVTVFSAVIGVVLAPIVGSVINGLFVLADQPYEIGDMIEISDSGRRGFVEDITLRYTKVFTMDNTFVVIPNSTIRERDVINYSAEDERTRLTLQVLVTYEGDVDEARRLIEKAARDVEVVITGGPDIRIGSARYPAGPTCYIDEFADHGVLLSLRYWAKEPYKLLTVRSAVQTNVWDALEDADVEIAYPHRHHVFDETSGQANVAVKRGAPEGFGPTGGNTDDRGPEPPDGA